MISQPIDFAFVSTMEGVPWGGSEELWAQTAMRLRREGATVAACIKDCGAQESAKVRELESAGVEILRRSQPAPLGTLELVAKKIRGKIGFETEAPNLLEQLATCRPKLTLISTGGGIPPLWACRPFIANSSPFAVLVQAAAEHWWPDDATRRDALTVIEAARAVYFVSEGNRQLVKRQLAAEHSNTRVVRNPFHVSPDVSVRWPENTSPWRFAFVGRLEPAAKGCDLLLEILAAPVWRERPVEVTFYGSGISAEGVRAHAAMLQLKNVHFAGHVDDVSEIWRTHHALVLPSRYEGLPLAVVEAMYCGRPCIVTDVAGNAELIDDGVTSFLAPAATINSVSETLERAWNARDRWREIGAKAAEVVRARVPRDPVGAFAAQLRELALEIAKT